MKFLVSILLVLVLIPVAFASTHITAIEKYYEYFAAEDMSAYFESQVPFDSDTLLAKEAHVQAIWDATDVVSYSLSEFSIDEHEGIALVSYTADFELLFVNENKLVKNKDRFAALLVRDKDWKVFMVGDEPGMQVALREALLEVEAEVEITTGSQASCGDGICELSEECVVDCTVIEFECTDCGNGAIVDLRKNIPREKFDSTCIFDDELLTSSNKDLTQTEVFSVLPNWIKDIVVGSANTAFYVDDTIYYLEIQDGIANARESLDDISYEVTVSSCTLSALEKAEITFASAYKQDLVTISGKKMTAKLKTRVASTVLTITSWFKPTPVVILVEAETGTAENFGRYSFIAPTSRGPGEAYLGEGGASVWYTVNIPKKGDYLLSVKVSDDARHASGSRSVTVGVGNSTLKYSHVSKNTITPNSPWDWQEVGLVPLEKGDVTIVFTKDATTSAAFAMDSFKLKK